MMTMMAPLPDPSDSRRRILRGAAAVSAAILTMGRAHAQAANFPNRTMRIVVPFTTGSGSDAVSRYYAEKFTAMWGQSVIVENRPGASGLITINSVKNAPADGYSIMLGNISLMAVNPIMLKEANYDPNKEFKPLHGLFRGAAIYVVPNDSKIRTLGDLIALAKTRAVSMGTYSQAYQLATAYLASLASVKFNNVPYKGQAPLVTDVIGNQLDAALLDFGGAIEMLRAGKVRPIAITSTERHPDQPNVPTVRESGFPVYEHYSWVGLFVRAETPEDITEKLSKAVAEILRTPDSLAFIKRNSGELMALPPAEMKRFVQSQADRFRKIATEAGVLPT